MFVYIMNNVYLCIVKTNKFNYYGNFIYNLFGWPHLFLYYLGGRECNQ